MMGFIMKSDKIDGINEELKALADRIAKNAKKWIP
jgi:hypothetical protein